MMKIYLLAGIIVMSGTSQAQDFIISGTVTDAETGEGLIGANVVESETLNGTVTDIEGNFQLTVSDENAEVSVSFIGYKTQVVPLNGRSQINVALGLDIGQLKEVVVVGYGTVRKSDLTGSVASIDAEEMVKVPSVNPMQALQGKVAGVQVTTGKGAPGEAPIVRIRGVGTTGNPDPIYVVDGVILNDINFLNAADIQSMEVLKDASATAIYGNRGANGVIIITTKLGKKGQDPLIQLSAEYSIQTLQRRIDLLDGREFGEVVNEINPGTYNNLNALPNTDWQELLFVSAPIQNYQVSLSGASERNQYYFAISYFDQGGIIPKSRYQRLTVKINDKFQPKEYLAFGTNLTLAPFIQHNTVNNAPFNVYRAQPVVEPYNEEGFYNEVPGVGNILGSLNFITDNKNRGIRSVGNFFVETYFLEGFTLRSSLGIDAQYDEQREFLPVYFISSAQQNETTYLRKRNATRASWLWENTLNYDKEFDIHRINGVVGYTLQNTANEFLELIGRDLFRTSDDFRYIDPSNLDPAVVSNGVDENNNFSMISYLGRFNYSFDERYLFTFTFRRDGSSKFLGENRYHNFPALAVGWNIINERFLTFPETLTNLKFRASWGKIGNEKIAYNRAYSRVVNNINAVFGLDEQTYFGQTFGALGNPDLIWEEVEQLDIGVELGMFNSRLTGEVDYYNRLTGNILIPLNIPAYLGNGTDQVTFNAAEVRNSGVEVAFNWRETKTEYSYSIGVNGTTVKNVTEKVSGTGGADDELAGITNNRTVSLTKKGLPVGAFYGYIVEGVFQTEEEINTLPSSAGAQPGDLRFRDVNDDGVINGEDRTYLGSPIPDFTYGIQLEGSVRSFDLSLDFQGQMGNKIYNIKETIRPALFNFEQHVLDYWDGPGTSDSEPRPTQGGANFEPSTRFIQDGGFFRLRTVSIGYTLPEKARDALKLKSTRIYVRGTNVFTLTQVTGYSPEMADSNPLLYGVDLGTYPVSSIYSVGINTNF